MPCCILLSTRDRDVFVKTVVRAFQRLDSVPLEIGARTMSFVCHEMFATREECGRRNPRIQSVPVFFSAITPGQHVRGATEWFIRERKGMPITA
jgi:hypothetical protein